LQGNVCRSSLYYALRAFNMPGQTVALRQAILSILDMTLRFRDALTVDVGQAPTTTEASRRIRPRLLRSRWEQQERKVTTGFAMTSRDITQAYDSDSDLEEEEASGHGPFASYYCRMSTLSHDRQQPFGDIYEMQDELDKLVRFIHGEVEGLAGNTSGVASAFSVLAFALEDWDR